MSTPVIVDAVRTPFGKRDGSFSDTHPQDLAAEPLTALRERNDFDPETVEDVVYGCVTPVDEQGLNVGRLAPMVAGWGDGVPGVQLNRMCGSGQQAINFAAGQVAAGYHDVIIAGGVEHMTRVPMGSDGQNVTVEEDEHPRPSTDVETLSKLPLSFRTEGDGCHHAGNSSGIVDGAGGLLVASEEAAEEHGWDPIARIVDTHVVGVDPVTMLTGPIPATEEILEQNDMSIDDIDRFEVNEAFATVVAAWLEETGADWEKTNVWGGAIAHGHPLGATGSALVGKLPYQLEECDGKYGLSTMCIGFGQGVATIIERL